MISTVIIVIAFLILGSILGAFKLSNYKDKEGDPNFKQIFKTGIALFISILAGIFQPIEIQRIDAGNVGLKIDRIGNSKGIPVARPCKGWVFYNSWTTDVVEYSIRQNHVAYKSFQVTTKGGFPITVSPSYNYALKPEHAADVYINLLKGGEFSSLEDNFLNTATVIALNNATNRYTIDSVFNNKEHYQLDVNAELNKELSKYFTVSQINPGVTPPPELSEVIKAKTETIQRAQQAELDKLTAQAEAETKIAKARGDSAALVISAQSEAEAIKIKQREITPTYVDFIRAQKWDGALPGTVLGTNTSVLLGK